MFNNHKELINISDLPERLKPCCDSPEIKPLMTYQDLNNGVDEILNITCRKKTCTLICPFKEIVDVDE